MQKQKRLKKKEKNDSRERIKMGNKRKLTSNNSKKKSDEESHFRLANNDLY